MWDNCNNLSVFRRSLWLREGTKKECGQGDKQEMRSHLGIIQAETASAGVVEADGITASPFPHSREDLRVSHCPVQIHQIGFVVGTRPGVIISGGDWSGSSLLLLLLLSFH